MIIKRRAFLAGLSSLIAAPAIVKASSLMPVRNMLPAETFASGGWAGGTPYKIYETVRVFNHDNPKQWVDVYRVVAINSSNRSWSFSQTLAPS